jgi:hypothetical protein
MPDLESGLEVLGAGFEFADLGIRQRKHGGMMPESRLEHSQNVNQ